MWGFGAVKRRKTKKSTKKTVSGGIMYAQRRKGGVTRTVQVITKGKKHYYKSDNKLVPKSAKLFANKTKASSFGSSKALSAGKAKKLRRPYGYVACIDHENNEGGIKYKVYKFYPVRWNGMLHRVIMDKSKYSGQMAVYIVPEQAKVFNVKMSGSDAQVKSSAAAARRRAQKQASDYTVLRYAGEDLSLIACKKQGLENLVTSGTGGGASVLRNFVSKMQARLGPSELSSQSRLASMNRGLMGGAGRFPFRYNAITDNFPISRNNGLYTRRNNIGVDYRGPYEVVDKDGKILSKEVFQNPISHSARLSSRMDDIPTGREFDGTGETILGLGSPSAFGRRRRRTPAAFGQRINYGFSKYF